MNKLWKPRFKEESGQALLEVALSASILFLLVFGVIDVSRAFYYQQVMKTLTGEGASMASRSNVPLSQVATTVINDAGTDLSFATKGCVIVTSVLNTATGTHPLQVSNQASSGSCTGLSSKIGCYPPPSACGNATLPSEAVAALAANQSLYVTEIYYSYSPVTPFAGGKYLPTQLYDAAYY
jgi:hypothetical protein